MYEIHVFIYWIFIYWFLFMKILFGFYMIVNFIYENASERNLLSTLLGCGYSVGDFNEMCFVREKGTKRWFMR